MRWIFDFAILKWKRLAFSACPPDIALALSSDRHASVHLIVVNLVSLSLDLAAVHPLPLLALSLLLQHLAPGEWQPVTAAPAYY